MTIEANKKIQIVLERLLEEHSLGIEKPYAVNMPVYDLVYDHKVELRNLSSIFEHLKEKRMLNDWILSNDEDDGECIMFFNDDFRELAKEYLKVLSPISELSLEDNTNNKIKFIEEKGKLFLINKNKKIRISDDMKSRQSKLIMFLSDPQIGVTKTIESVAEAIRLPKDETSEGYLDKKNLINNTFKEIQRTLAKEKSPIKLKLIWTKGSVAMAVKVD